MCSAAGRYYGLGLPKNSMLIEKLTPAVVTARRRSCLCGAPSVREFAEFDYQTKTSWLRARRVIAKAAVLTAGDNPRVIVTNPPADGFKGDEDRARFGPTPMYEEFYCARDEMETVLTQQVLDLAADKLITHFFRAQPIAPVAGELCLSAARTAARLGLPRDRIGAGHPGHAATEAVKSGRARDGQRAAGGSSAQQRLCVAGLVSPLPRATDAAND